MLKGLSGYMQEQFKGDLRKLGNVIVRLHNIIFKFYISQGRSSLWLLHTAYIFLNLSVLPQVCSDVFNFIECNLKQIIQSNKP